MMNTYRYSRGYMFKQLVAMKILFFSCAFTGLLVGERPCGAGQNYPEIQRCAPSSVFCATIQAQSRYSFVFQSEAIPPGTEININTKDASIDSVMTQLLRNTQLSYKKLENNVIVILNRQAPEVRTSTQPPVSVKGVVKDKAGGLMPHVSVYIKGTQTGTMTNEKGEFTIKANQYDSLVFSFVGYKPQTVFISDSRTLIIVLDAQEGSLNEVAVVGYSRQKKSSMVASVTTIKPGELRIPSSNLTNALAGRLAGVVAYQRSGEPGQDNTAFFIRGITSFGASAKDGPAHPHRWH